MPQQSPSGVPETPPEATLPLAGPRKTGLLGPTGRELTKISGARHIPFLRTRTYANYGAGGLPSTAHPFPRRRMRTADVGFPEHGTPIISAPRLEKFHLEMFPEKC